MTDTTLIWDAITILIPDSHPAIYQYMRGQSKSKETAMMRIIGVLEPLFRGAYDVSKIRKVSREYLQMKHAEYKKGNIKVKSIY